MHIKIPRQIGRDASADVASIADGESDRDVTFACPVYSGVTADETSASRREGRATVWHCLRSVLNSGWDAHR